MPEAPLPLHSPLPASLQALLSRASVPPRLLHAPAPDDACLSLAAAAAQRAPDHGGLKPWRFLCISGEGRARLGDLLAASLAARMPDTPEARLDLERAKPLRSPLVVAAGAALRQHPKIPAWEQEASAAAGTMNFIHALEALGFGCFWASSPALGDATVKGALGFAESDSLLGWIYVGTPGEDRPQPVRIAPDGLLRHWQPG